MNKAMFWDFDGTLVHSNTSFLDSLESAIKTYGYQIFREDIGGFLKEVCSWYVPQKSYPDKTVEMWWQELFDNIQDFCEKHAVKAEDRRRICQLFRQKVISYEYQPYEDVEEVLSYCQKLGYDNYVISNNYPELVNVIERYGWDKYFKAYILSANIGYEKPRIEIYQYALAVAGHPDVCYMVGDNPIADIEGSIKAGMKAILVHNRFRNGALEEVPVCEELRKLKEIVQ